MNQVKKQIVIKVTLTEEEYNSIVELAEMLDRPLAGTVKELITFSALVGHYGTALNSYIEKKIGKIEMESILLATSKKDQVSYLRIKLFLLQLNKFSKSWRVNKIFVDK